jgi:mono/diheme cytochrome c family protein
MKHGEKILLHVEKIAVVTTCLLLCACKMYYPTEKIEYEVQSDDRVEGKRLTMITCGACHYNADTKSFSGNRLKDSPAFLGKIYAANITQDNLHGVGEYTPGELAYLIRTGISRSGKSMPYMYRPNIADEDLQAIIAYLKSNDAAVSPSPQDPGQTKYSLIGKLGISLSKPGEYNESKIEKPTSDISLGKYLVDNLGCYHCHSKSFASLDNIDPEKSKGFMGGGNKLRDANGKKVKTPNLTPHVTGIVDWTETDLKRALTKGISKDNSIITYPMPLYPELTDEETHAIYSYLKSIPAISNEVNN